MGRSTPSTVLIVLLRLPLLACSMLLLGGCFGPSTARGGRLPVPEISGGHHLGSPLSGSMAGLHSTPPLLRRVPAEGESFVVTGSASLVPATLGSEFPRLQAQASMIVAPLASAPLQAGAVLLHPLQVGQVSGLYTWLEGVDDPQPLQEVRGALDVGTTFTLRVALDGPEPEARREYELAVSRSTDAGGLQAAISCELRHEAGQTLSWEQAMLDVGPELDGRALVVLAPSADPHVRLMIALSVDPIRGGPDFEELAPIVDSAREEVDAGWRKRLDLLASVTAAISGRPDLAAGVIGLGREPSRRSALLYLAGELAAPVAVDLALTGRVDLIDALASELQQGLAVVAGDDVAGLRHLLQASALGVLARRVDAGDGDLLMDSLLIRHTGEVGRHPARLLELLELYADSDVLAAALVAENRLFLEDNAPSSRVRAFDWLLVHDLAPAGYDPLGDRASRRAALAQDAAR